MARCLGVADRQLVQTRTPSGSRCSSRTCSSDLVRGHRGAARSMRTWPCHHGRPGDPAQLAGLLQLGEHPVDVPGRHVDVLEEQDGPLQLELPWRAHGLEQQPAGHRARARWPGRRGYAGGRGRRGSDSTGPVPSPRSVASSRSRVKSLASVQPMRHQMGAVEDGPPGRLAQGDVQGGDVGVATEGLQMLGDQLEVEVGEQLHRPTRRSGTGPRLDLGVGEHRLQVSEPGFLGRRRVRFARASIPSASFTRYPRARHPQPAQQVQRLLQGSPRPARRYSPVGQLPAEPGRLDHTGHRPAPQHPRSRAPTRTLRPARPPRRPAGSPDWRGSSNSSIRSAPTRNLHEDGKRPAVGRQDGAPSGTGTTAAVRRRRRRCWPSPLPSSPSAPAMAGVRLALDRPGVRAQQGARRRSRTAPVTAVDHAGRVTATTVPPRRSCLAEAASCSPATGWFRLLRHARTSTCSAPARPTSSPSGC